MSFLAIVCSHVSRAGVWALKHSVADGALCGVVLGVFLSMPPQRLICGEHGGALITLVHITPRVLLHVVDELFSGVKLRPALLTLGRSILLNLLLDLQKVWQQDGQYLAIWFSPWLDLAVGHILLTTVSVHGHLNTGRK